MERASPSFSNKAAETQEVQRNLPGPQCSGFCSLTRGPRTRGGCKVGAGGRNLSWSHEAPVLGDGDFEVYADHSKQQFKPSPLGLTSKKEKDFFF